MNESPFKKFVDLRRPKSLSPTPSTRNTVKVDLPPEVEKLDFTFFGEPGRPNLNQDLSQNSQKSLGQAVSARESENQISKDKTDENQISKEKTEEIKTEEIKTEEIKTEEIKTEENQIPKEKTEENKIEEINTEENKTEENKTEEIKTTEDKKEENKKEENKTEEKKKEDNKKEDKKTDENKKEENQISKDKTEDKKPEENKKEETKTEDNKISKKETKKKKPKNSSKVSKSKSSSSRSSSKSSSSKSSSSEKDSKSKAKKRKSSISRLHAEHDETEGDTLQRIPQEFTPLNRKENDTIQKMLEGKKTVLTTTNIFQNDKFGKKDENLLPENGPMDSERKRLGSDDKKSIGESLGKSVEESYRAPAISGIEKPTKRKGSDDTEKSKDLQEHGSKEENEIIEEGTQRKPSDQRDKQPKRKADDAIGDIRFQPDSKIEVLDESKEKEDEIEEKSPISEPKDLVISSLGFVTNQLVSDMVEIYLLKTLISDTDKQIEELEKTLPEKEAKDKELLSTVQNYWNRIEELKLEKQLNSSNTSRYVKSDLDLVDLKIAQIESNLERIDVGKNFVLEDFYEKRLETTKKEEAFEKEVRNLELELKIMRSTLVNLTGGYL